MTTGFIHNPHDKFFRSSMAQISVARGFFQSHLPSDIQKQIDFDTLSMKKDTFVDDAFKASEADLLYRVKLLNQSTAYLYLLCKHLSSVDKNIAFQVLVYLIDIMKQHRAQHRPWLAALLSSSSVKSILLFTSLSFKMSEA